jgi:hypothetical protein
MPREHKLFVERGQRFGLGTVIDPDFRVGGQRAPLMRCDCGNLYTPRLVSLVSRGEAKPTQSCGCLLSGGRQRALRCWHIMLREPGQVVPRWHDLPAYLRDVEQEPGFPPPGFGSPARADEQAPFGPGNLLWRGTHRTAELRELAAASPYLVLAPPRPYTRPDGRPPRSYVRRAAP